MNKEAGEFREQAKARLKYLKMKKKEKEKKISDEDVRYYMAGHVGAGVKKTEKKMKKKASEQLDELYKEAGLINHASKVVNGVKPVAPKIKPIQGAVKPKKIVGDLNV